jgi:hypothetical protein
MPRKTYSPENIIGKLRQIEVLISQGHSEEWVFAFSERCR